MKLAASIKQSFYPLNQNFALMRKHIFATLLVNLLFASMFAQPNNIQVKEYYTSGTFGHQSLDNNIALFDGTGSTLASGYSSYQIKVYSDAAGTMQVGTTYSVPNSNPGIPWHNISALRFNTQYYIRITAIDANSTAWPSSVIRPYMFQPNVQFRGYYCSGSQWVSLLDPVKFYKGQGSVPASIYDAYYFKVTGYNGNLSTTKYLPLSTNPAAPVGYNSSLPSNAYWKDISELNFGEQYTFKAFIKHQGQWYESTKACTPLFQHRVQVQGYFCHGNQKMNLHNDIALKEGTGTNNADDSFYYNPPKYKGYKLEIKQGGSLITSLIPYNTSTPGVEWASIPELKYNECYEMNVYIVQNNSDVAPGNSCNTICFDNCPPGTLTITESVTDDLCGNTNGTINLNVSGGNTPYTYSWSNGQTGASINNLSSGSYTVTVKDNRGCFEEKTITVNASGTPPTLTALITLTANSTTGNATYSWSNEDNYSLVLYTTSSISVPMNGKRWHCVVSDDCGQTILCYITPNHNGICMSAKTNSTTSTEKATKTEKEQLRSYDFNLYPNPNDGTFTLSINGNSTPLKLLIFNLSGKQVGQYSIPSGTEKYQWQNEKISDGIYFYQVISREKILHTDKFMVNK